MNCFHIQQNYSSIQNGTGLNLLKTYEAKIPYTLKNINIIFKQQTKPNIIQYNVGMI